MKTCSIPGCEKKQYGLSVCNMHYKRWENHNNFFFNSKRCLTKERRKPGEGTFLVGYLVIRKKREHQRIAENVLGKPINFPHIVHHVNGNKSDNRNSNLVICEDRKYHKMLHNRENAIKNGYPAYYRKCGFCHNYDDPAVLVLCGRCYRHPQCARDYANNKTKLRRILREQNIKPTM